MSYHEATFWSAEPETTMSLSHKQLERKQHALRRNLVRPENQAEQEVTGTNTVTLQKILAKLQMELQRLTTVDDAVLDGINNEDEQDTKYKEVYEIQKQARGRIFAIQQRINRISSPQIRADAIPENTRVSHANNTNKLPQLNLPTFSGEYKEWVSFED